MAEKHANFWRDEGKTWNVKRAEESIAYIKRFANYIAEHPEKGSAAADEVAPILKALTSGRPEALEPMTNAVTEMAAIMEGKDPSVHYRINHITSGKSVFQVFINNGKSYYIAEVFDSEEDAKQAAGKYYDAYYEKDIAGEEGKWDVWVPDEEQTNSLRSAKICGEYACEFDTEEEANAEAEAYEDAFVVETPSEEWYAVINMDTGKNAFDMLFPSEVRALAFLYDAAKPAAWMAFTDIWYKEGA